MTEILLYYVVPNVMLFGSLYLLGKAVEASTWYVICNYEELTKVFDIK